MIINYDSPGQLCNRIWSLVPSIAYGLEYNEKVLVINFEGYTDIFEDLNSNPLVRFASRRLLKKFIHSLKVRGRIQNGKPNIFSRLLKWNMVEGWPNRLGNAEMVWSQSDKIRGIFRFKKEITDAVGSIISPLKSTYTIVGVHIRRGDYKEWLNGIYYYTDEEYCRLMKNVQEQISTVKGSKVKFLICSNENINLDNYSGLDCFVIPDSSGAKDLYGLSKCNYIIGPPSSYSQWASFYGKVPVNYILSANEELTLSDFSGIISFNTFENGNILDID